MSKFSLLKNLRNYAEYLRKKERGPVKAFFHITKNGNVPAIEQQGLLTNHPNANINSVSHPKRGCFITSISDSSPSTSIVYVNMSKFLLSARAFMMFSAIFASCSLDIFVKLYLIISPPFLRNSCRPSFPCIASTNNKGLVCIRNYRYTSGAYI